MLFIFTIYVVKINANESYRADQEILVGRSVYDDFPIQT